jgi:hippurate hydrolase
LPSTAAHSPVARVLAGVDEIETWQEGVYRTLHEHPELPFAEVRTAGTAAGALRDAGFGSRRRSAGPESSAR